MVENGIYCTCGELVAFKKGKIMLTNEVIRHTLLNNRMIAECNCCKSKIKIDGILFPII